MKYQFLFKKDRSLLYMSLKTRWILALIPWRGSDFQADVINTSTLTVNLSEPHFGLGKLHKIWCTYQGLGKVSALPLHTKGRSLPLCTKGRAPMQAFVKVWKISLFFLYTAKKGLYLPLYPKRRVQCRLLQRPLPFLGPSPRCEEGFLSFMKIWRRSLPLVEI